MSGTFKIEGLQELDKALEQIAKKSTRTATMRRALQKAAQPMATMAASYAPYLTGDLEAGIKIRAQAMGEVGKAAYADAKRAGGTNADAVAAMRDARREAKASRINPAVALYMGPTRDLFYARFQEFGTINHAADPFMRPAFDAEAKPTIERIKPLLWAEIEKSIARAAKKGM